MSASGGPRDPGSLSLLQRRITEAARRRDQTVRRVQVTVAQLVVAQMLPPSVVKGGSAMKLRFGESFARDSSDLDTVARDGVESFLADLSTLLERGWDRFAGKVVEVPPATPLGVPTPYVMRPFDVRLTYRGRAFTTLRLEVGHDELDVLGDDVEQHLAPDAVELFAELGLAAPAPVPLLPASVQIAQKLHACSAPRSQRAHDLVDLQLLAPSADPAAVAGLARRLFAFRRSHDFPPTITVDPGWDALYAEAATGLGVLPGVEEAAEWANAYVARLVRCG